MALLLNIGVLCAPILINLFGILLKISARWRTNPINLLMAFLLNIYKFQITRDYPVDSRPIQAVDLLTC